MKNRCGIRRICLVFATLWVIVPAYAGNPDWLSDVEADIRASEYHITWQDRIALSDLEEAWQSPNRAHNFRIYYTETGIRVIPRTGAETSWEWVLAYNNACDAEGPR